MEKITPRSYDDRIIAQGFQFQIDTYYEPKDPAMIRRVKTVIEAIDPKPGERILDIGCGVGTFAYRCASAGALSIGVDYSRESIKAAKALCERYGVGKNAGFLVADGTALPFKDLYFDKIVAADFIEHTTDEEKFKILGEIKRLLKPEGIAVIFTPNGTREKIGSIYRKFRHALFGEGIPTTELHFGLTTRGYFEKLCKRCGLASKLSYEDTTRPYLAKLPFIRRFLALDLLWALKKNEIRNILVINLGGIGDVLLSVPALRALKAAYPEAVITSMVVPRAAGILAGTAYVDGVIGFSTSFKDSLSDLSILLGLRRRRFDIAVNMRTIVTPSSARKMKFIFDIIHPALSAGRDNGGLGYFFDIKIPETLVGQKFEMEYDLDIVRSLGAETSDRQIDFIIDENSSMRIKGLMDREGIGESDVIIGIHPGGEPARRWPVENFAQTMRKIGGEVKCSFAVTGSAEEASLADRLIGMAGVKAINMAGHLTIRELGALVKRCNIFISNDTGPMHIAAVLKTPLIALFGPGDITRFDPRNIMPDAVVLYKKAECSPCEKYQCTDLRCLKAIMPDEVIKAALSFLNMSGAL